MTIDYVLREIIQEEVNKAILQNLDEIISRVSQIKEPSLAIPDMLTVEAFAKYIGCRKPTIYGLIHRNALPYYKPTGKRVYFKLTEVNEWLVRHRKKSFDEIERDATDYLMGT